MKVYIAGPMTGLPQFNFPAFDIAKVDLVKLGYDVVSPSELDNPADRAAALASPDGSALSYGSGVKAEYWDFIERDLRIIATDGIEAIVVLPGWEKSRGARIESFTGHLHGMPIIAYTADRFGVYLNGVNVVDLARAWSGVSDLYGHSVYQYMSIGRDIPAVEYE